MADPARAKKLADRIKVVVAEQLEHRLKDPRLGFVTITDVRVTGDLQHATIFYTVLGDLEELLRNARQHDADVAASATSAAYAGEADPYKRPADDAG